MSMRFPLVVIGASCCALAFAACGERVVDPPEVPLSLSSTYHQWLYTGSSRAGHRFVVRSSMASAAGEVIDEHAVLVPAADLRLRATMPVTADRSRWVEFFSRVDTARAVGEGMQVARIRRSLDYVPPPYGPLLDPSAPTP
jgi:hypothetical protein